MTIDTPLICYICGKTSDRATIDLLGCLKEQEKASKRFQEKFNRRAKGYIDICPKCRKNNRSYAKKVEKKYGVID